MTSPHNAAPEPQHAPAPASRQEPSSGSTTGSKADAGSIGLIILVILAVIASLVMLISGSANALKIALLASLWAAVLGFFLVVRYRRQAHEATELLAVERAHAASSHTQAAAAAPADNSKVLADIRAELESIRSQIEELSGREWVYEPAALYAEARRIQELERKASSADSAAHFGDSAASNFTQKSGGAPTADAVAGRLGSQPTHPTHNTLDSLLADSAGQATTAQQPQPVQPTQQAQQPRPKAQPQEQPSQRQPQHTQPQQPQKPAAPSFKTTKPAQPAQSAQPSQQKQPERPEFKTDSFQAVRWNQGASEAASPKSPAASASSAAPHRHRKPEEDAPQKQAVPRPASPQAQHQGQQSVGGARSAAAETSRGRRRSDEKRDGAVSVAELMAEMKKRQKDKKEK
ncbi:DUF4229 domain-containing protein [uncultured Corynebacterium sp.]|uniref:DUF4229 domain-containing protein n=1 Tax=uncultured Corynebacterium sp. TaxID=159447 RepID=UPI0025D72F60|nr:DUF4229 domain-containing protein [uncultured Corynebacterium sp.]